MIQVQRIFTTNQKENMEDVNNVLSKIQGKVIYIIPLLRAGLWGGATAPDTWAVDIYYEVVNDKENLYAECGDCHIMNLPGSDRESFCLVENHGRNIKENTQACKNFESHQTLNKYFSNKGA